jgi:hypothetical protein
MTEAKTPAKPAEAKPEVNLLEEVKKKFDSIVIDLDNLTEDNEEKAYEYIVKFLEAGGYVIHHENDEYVTDGSDDGERLFNISMLFDANGYTKNPRLDEIQSNAYQYRQGNEPTMGVNTAREVVDAIMNRSGISNSPQRDKLTQLFTRALNSIKDPARWQNPQTDFYDTKRKQK